MLITSRLHFCKGENEFARQVHAGGIVRVTSRSNQERDLGCKGILTKRVILRIKMLPGWLYPVRRG